MSIDNPAPLEKAKTAEQTWSRLSRSSSWQYSSDSTSTTPAPSAILSQIDPRDAPKSPIDLQAPRPPLK